MTSSPNDLPSRRGRRLEADDRQIEEKAASGLQRLGEGLSAVVNIEQARETLAEIEETMWGLDLTEVDLSTE